MIKKCSTLNNFKVRFLLVFVSALFFVSAVFVPLSFAAAAPVAVPVTAEIVGELLVALGLMAGNAVDGYVWKANDNPYVTSIFENQINAISSDIPVSSETLKPLLGSVIPDGVYSQSPDGDFLIAGNPVTASDIFLQAKSLIGVTYGLPVNVYSISSYSPLTEGIYHGWYSPIGVSDVNNGNCFIPIYGYNGQILISPFGLAVYPSSLRTFRFNGANISNNAQSGGSSVPNFISAGTSNVIPFVLGVDTPSINGNYRASTSSAGGSGVRDVFGNTYILSNIWNDIEFSTFAVTRGVPTDIILADENEIETAVVRVEINNFNPVPPDGGNKPDKTIVVPAPPVWELWRSIADLLTEISDGVDTNNDTTLGGYINNNYNYQSVDVDVNVPDKIDVGLSGGFDINGKGDININFNEDVSLPSAGDGSGFYNPNAADVVGALNNNNPVISGIKGLFAAIDPALVGVFSVSVSLMLVLGLWKLIRG